MIADPNTIPLTITNNLVINFPLNESTRHQAINSAVDTIKRQIASKNPNNVALLNIKQVSALTVNNSTAGVSNYLAEIRTQITGANTRAIAPGTEEFYYLRNENDYLCLQCNSMFTTAPTSHALECLAKMEKMIKSSGCIPCGCPNKQEKSYYHLFDNNHWTNSFSGISAQTLDLRNIKDIRHHLFNDCLWLPASILAFADSLMHIQNVSGALNHYFYQHSLLDMCNAAPLILQAVTEIKMSPLSQRTIKLSCPQCCNHANAEMPFHYSIIFYLFRDSIRYYNANCGHHALEIYKELDACYYPLHHYINEKLAGKISRVTCYYNTTLNKDDRSDYDGKDREKDFHRARFSTTILIASSQSIQPPANVDAVVDDLFDALDLEINELSNSIFNQLMLESSDLLEQDELRFTVSFDREIQLYDVNKSRFSSSEAIATDHSLESEAIAEKSSTSCSINSGPSSSSRSSKKKIKKKARNQKKSEPEQQKERIGSSEQQNRQNIKYDSTSSETKEQISNAIQEASADVQQPTKQPSASSEEEICEKGSAGADGYWHPRVGDHLMDLYNIIEKKKTDEDFNDYFIRMLFDNKTIMYSPLETATTLLAKNYLQYINHDPGVKAALKLATPKFHYFTSSFVR